LIWNKISNQINVIFTTTKSYGSNCLNTYKAWLIQDSARPVWLEPNQCHKRIPFPPAHLLLGRQCNPWPWLQGVDTGEHWFSTKKECPPFRRWCLRQGNGWVRRRYRDAASSNRISRKCGQQPHLLPVPAKRYWLCPQRPSTSRKLWKDYPSPMR